jgi:hypothetical protein
MSLLVTDAVIFDVRGSPSDLDVLTPQTQGQTHTRQSFDLLLAYPHPTNINTTNTHDLLCQRETGRYCTLIPEPPTGAKFL